MRHFGINLARSKSTGRLLHTPSSLAKALFKMYYFQYYLQGFSSGCLYQNVFNKPNRPKQVKTIPKRRTVDISVGRFFSVYGIDMDYIPVIPSIHKIVKQTLNFFLYYLFPLKIQQTKNQNNFLNKKSKRKNNPNRKMDSCRISM